MAQNKELIDWLIAKACENKGVPAPELLAQARATLGALDLDGLFQLFFKVEYGDRGDKVPEYTEVCRILYPEPRLVTNNAA